MSQNSVLWPLQFPLGYSAILFDCVWRPLRSSDLSSSTLRSSDLSSGLPLVLQHILCSFRDFFSWQVMPQNSVLWPLQYPLGYSAILFECTWWPLSSSWRQIRRPGLLCEMIVDDVCLSKLVLTHNPTISGLSLLRCWTRFTALRYHVTINSV